MDFKRIKELKAFEAQLINLKKRYEEYRGREFLPLTRELFDIFYETGSRKEYEDVYFTRRGALLMSALMCLIYGEKEHLDELVRVIDVICDEFTWALPAHMEKSNPAPERVIDLFAAETAQALAEICARIEIPQKTRQKIHEEIERRTVRPFIEEVYNWESITNNWAAVCAGSVGMAFLYEFPTEFEQIEDRILSAMENYLSGFGDDGICPEGLGYWNYGFWYFTAFADLYKEKCGVDLTKNPKVRAIARCQQNLFLAGDTVISYSDCSRSANFNSGLAHYYRNRFGAEVRLISDEISDGVDNCFRFATALRSILYLDEGLLGIKEAPQKESFFADCCWYVKRGKKFAFSAKGGSNGESHNHNDLGSFIIADKDNQLLADYGAGEYTHDYFTEKRYEELCCSSKGHSVPIIDGQLQAEGGDKIAPVIKSENGCFETELCAAYDIKTLKSLKRSFEVGEDYVELKDKFVFGDTKCHKITERFVSVIKPCIKDGKAVIKNAVLECDITPKISKETLKAHDASEDVLYFVDYETDGDFELTFKIL